MKQTIRIVTDLFLFLFFILIVTTPTVVSLNLDPKLIEEKAVTSSNEVKGVSVRSEDDFEIFKSILVVSDGGLEITYNRVTGREYEIRFIVPPYRSISHTIRSLYNPQSSEVHLQTNLVLNSEGIESKITINGVSSEVSMITFQPHSGEEIGLLIANPSAQAVSGTFTIVMID